MTDLEARLADALRDGAEDAPDALGLADGARGRLRSRRRTRSVVGIVAAVVAVTVPVSAVSALAGHDSEPGPLLSPNAQATTLPAAAPAYRWETWHGVSVQVPNGWKDGSLEAWCADGQSRSSMVERPGTLSLHILCTPRSTYGLRFSWATKPGLNWPVAVQDGSFWPAGAEVGTRDVAGVLVEVATPSFALSQRILSTVMAGAPARS